MEYFIIASRFPQYPNQAHEQAAYFDTPCTPVFLEKRFDTDFSVRN